MDGFSRFWSIGTAQKQPPTPEPGPAFQSKPMIYIEAKRTPSGHEALPAASWLEPPKPKPKT